MREIQHIDWSQDYTAFSTLSPVEKRKMLKRMAKTIPLRKMTYEQAKLYHRLKGRI